MQGVGVAKRSCGIFTYQKVRVKAATVCAVASGIFSNSFCVIITSEDMFKSVFFA